MTQVETVDVLVLGELNPDLLLSGAEVTPCFGQVETLVDSASLALGSSGAIFAAGVAKLGMHVTMAGLVGDDTFGDFVTRQLRGHGVSTEGVVVDPSVATGLTVILNRGADRAILTHPGAMAQMTAEHLNSGLLDRARHVHATSYFLQRSLQQGLPEVLQRAKDSGASTSLDTNWDPSERWNDGVHELLPLVDTFLPNENEAMALTGMDTPRAAAEALGRTVPTVVVKRGALGAHARCDGQEFEAQAPRAQVRDTTGAGDSFDAGYVFGLLTGLSMPERLRAACLCGSRSTEGIGGVSAQLTAAELRSALAETPS